MAPVIKVVELPTGVRLPYVEQGDPSGLPVLLLHGFVDSWRSFEPVLPHLPQALHVFALTQRGHGDASRPAAGYSVQDLAADLAAFIDALHLHAAVIVGHSMGSAVALRFAIDHPERTAGLVLIGASASLGATAAARAFWDSTLSKLTDPVDPDLVREMTEAMIVQPIPRAFLDTVVAEGQKVPAHVWRAVLESRWRLEGDFSEQLDQIQAPTLIFWGDQDARYPRSAQEALVSAIPGSRWVIYAGAGHMPHWEQPERFASDLVDFCDQVARCA
jgi:pimeloyl-ACP methyl ester carboxylesterase